MCCRKDSKKDTHNLSEISNQCTALSLNCTAATSKQVFSALVFSKSCKDRVTKSEDHSAQYHPSYRQE